MEIPPARIQAGAELLARHRLEGLVFGGFPEDSRPQSEQEGYEIQAVLHEPARGLQATGR